MLATVVGLLKSIYIYTHHTLSRSIYSLPPPMLSSTSITPSVKSYKMPSASSQDLRVDHTWYRSQHFTLISVLRRRKVAACLTYFWLIFAMAFDDILQFGLGNCKNAQVFSQVTDFVVEQWGVCPLQIEHFPSGGKTIWYLLLFDVIDYSISISCLVGG